MSAGDKQKICSMAKIALKGSTLLGLNELFSRTNVEREARKTFNNHGLQCDSTRLKIKILRYFAHGR